MRQNHVNTAFHNRESLFESLSSRFRKTTIMRDFAYYRRFSLSFPEKFFRILKRFSLFWSPFQGHFTRKFTRRIPSAPSFQVCSNIQFVRMCVDFRDSRYTLCLFQQFSVWTSSHESPHLSSYNDAPPGVGIWAAHFILFPFSSIIILMLEQYRNGFVFNTISSRCKVEILSKMWYNTVNRQLSFFGGQKCRLLMFPSGLLLVKWK